MLTELFGEFLGTAILILLGNGVVANVNLKNTIGNGSGWIVITTGWALAVFTAVFMTADLSGAHLNPAVTIGLAVAGQFAWVKVLPFILAQVGGGMFGALMVYLFYIDHFKITTAPGMKRACFCTAPAIANTKSNFFSEAIGTFVLVLGVLLITVPQFQMEGMNATKVGLGSLGAMPVALVVFVIGLSLGGTTGYAINPARDLGPRIVHALLPLNVKDDNGWKYAWVPIVGPVAGCFLAAFTHMLILYLLR
ncbi:aquaporin family protein [Maribellus sp. CM-23]|uniref:MIP/aquaporin family protein n=1 Tax=Maribellus sp. CM-23 TaxID=2781026 RepID=UPI001F1E038C|nr:MIP/aquaporin family protein [Maribellus sp. CM-23]MCE4565443.1 aquaporin family protein [Maribellus sp. CM-23]